MFVPPTPCWHKYVKLHGDPTQGGDWLKIKQISFLLASYFSFGSFVMFLLLAKKMFLEMRTFYLPQCGGTCNFLFSPSKARSVDSTSTCSLSSGVWWCVLVQASRVSLHISARLFQIHSDLPFKSVRLVKMLLQHYVINKCYARVMNAV